MVSRKLSLATAGLAVAFATALLGQTAAAMEEVVAYRTDSPVKAVDHASRFQEEMARYAQSLNKDLKDRLAKELEQLPCPKVELATSEVPTRG